MVLTLCSTQKLWTQHQIEITAKLDGQTKEIQINQKLTYHNTSGVGLSVIYLNDWMHAFANKKTALAKRFELQFKRSLHLAKDEERGYTDITSVVDDSYAGLLWERLDNRDILKVELAQPLADGEKAQIFITYKVQLPDKKFTTFGYGPNNEFNLRHWYLTPAVFKDGEWLLYDNLDFDDLYTAPADTRINLNFPEGLHLATNFQDAAGVSRFPGGQFVQLKGSNRGPCTIMLTNRKRFTKHVTRFLTVTSDLETKNYDDISQGISIHKVSKFISEHLGSYPYENVLISTVDYNKSPLYGINQLPSFIRPYDEQFQFEMKFLKTTLRNVVKESLFINPRKERWVLDGIVNYLMIKYVEIYYPNQKLVGKLSKLWGFKGFHLAQMDFNEQYSLLSMFPARSNIDQALTTPADSLIKINEKIANAYKAGLGLTYLSAYLGKEEVDESIKLFYKSHLLDVNSSAKDFKNVLEAQAKENIDWFFNEYVSTRKKIDYKIKSIIKKEDSITFTLKNKRGTNVPISLYGLNKDSVVSKYWFTDIDTSKTYTIPRNGETRLVLNYDQKIPEFNQRDNWKTLNGFFSSNKKLKFQFFKDTEDPYYNQVFYVPIANFNVYDGITPGMRLYNKTFLERPFTYDIAPTYSFLEKTLVGRSSLRYRKYHGKSGLYVSNYAISASTSHFQVNSRFSTITPSVVLGWRPDDLISNRRQSLLFRYVNVFRDIDPSIADEIDTDPDYSVLNVRFRDVDNNIINFSSWALDAQHAADFTKLTFELEYRKLFESNRQLNLRLFGGKFLRNNTDSDFFSFALDRPTDYLFDLPYLGRSEDSGIYSQQIIIAEGGFKSQLPNPFANDWIVTGNASTNIWRWIEAYGDIGFMKNRGENARFVYDSGIRLNLVTDYFELYFPVYSKLGWEIAQPNYGERIRFIVTISPRTLIGLFTRHWF